MRSIMNSRVRIILILIFICIPFISENGLASGPPYSPAKPGYQYQFPYDHGAHPEFQTEWWYYTGHLKTEKGEAFGFELTFFRFGNNKESAFKNPSRWAVKDIYMAHFAISSIKGKNFTYYEKISREALGKAGAKKGQLKVWIDDWSVEEVDGVHILKASHPKWEINLKLVPSKTPVIHGKDGISRKGGLSGEASHYYSLTRLQVIGDLREGNNSLKVEGQAWMDHEFSTHSLPKELAGWDWFSIQLDNQWELMIYQLRQKDGSLSPFSSGTLVDPKGKAIPLKPQDFEIKVLDHWESKKSKGTYPILWQVLLPDKKIDLTLRPAFSDQELITSESTQVTYWEGAVKIRGKWNGLSVTGKGYTEMTGYSNGLTGP